WWPSVQSNQCTRTFKSADLGPAAPGPGEMVGTGGIEPPTSSASRKRSPTELRACVPRPPTNINVHPTGVRTQQGKHRRNHQVPISSPRVKEARDQARERRA